MTQREGGIPRDKAIERARIEIERAKSHFDGWLNGQLKELQKLIKTVDSAELTAEWLKTANFHSHQLRDSAVILNFDLLAFVAGSLCEILDSIEAGGECSVESIICHIESVLLASRVSYRHLKPEQVPELTEGLIQVAKRAVARPST
jgi:hypothetical protein